MPRPKKITQEEEEKIVDNPKKRKVRLIPEDSPIKEEEDKEEQVVATGEQELTYEMYDNKKEIPTETVGHKGKIISITVSKTRQFDQFEPDKCEISYMLGDGEDVTEVYLDLRDTVYNLLDEPMD